MKLKLDHSLEQSDALLLAAVVASEVACGLGTQAVVRRLSGVSLALDITDALSSPNAVRYRELFATRLARQLGVGFTVTGPDEHWLVTVAVDSGFVDPEEPLSDEKLTAGSTAPSTMLNSGDGGMPRRRGRPPGSVTKARTEPLG